MYDRHVARASESLAGIARSFLRFATAAERIAAAMEETNRLGIKQLKASMSRDEWDRLSHDDSEGKTTNA